MSNNDTNSIHLIGLCLDNEDGHKRLTQADEFAVIGGSEETHAQVTETLIKTNEDIHRRGKRLATTNLAEITDLLTKYTP